MFILKSHLKWILIEIKNIFWKDGFYKSDHCLKKRFEKVMYSYKFFFFFKKKKFKQKKSLIFIYYHGGPSPSISILWHRNLTNLLQISAYAKGECLGASGTQRILPFSNSYSRKHQFTINETVDEPSAKWARAKHGCEVPSWQLPTVHHFPNGIQRDSILSIYQCLLAYHMPIFLMEFVWEAWSKHGYGF